jgi:PPE-repeat protein
MDYGLLPPEINSARMYSGPGAGSMIAAASAWDEVAGQLGSAAVAYSSAIAGLNDGAWSGPAANAMAAAAAPYVTWLHNTAAQAEQTANQARAAVAAYENAFAMTVPPPLIAANRAQLATLIATNVLGQNAPAIAATEAHYGEMWAQDAGAMYGYAGSSAAASQVTPFSAAPQTTSSAGQSSQTAAVDGLTAASAGTDAQAMLSQLTTSTPQALQSLSAPGSTTSSGSGLSSTSGLTSAMDSLKSEMYPMTMASMMPMRALSMINMLKSLSTAGGAAKSLTAATPALAGGVVSSTGALGSAAGVGATGNGAAVVAGLGKSVSMGPLSVPQSWAAAAVPEFTPIGAGLPAGGFGAVGAGPEATASGMPMLPIAHLAGRGVGGVTPHYDMRPTVVPRTPAAG